MDRLRLAASAAVATCLLGRVEYNPTFAAPTVGRHLAAPRSAGAAAPQASSAPSATGLVGVAAVGAVALAARRRQQASPRTQVKADLSGLVPEGPIVAYTDALMDASMKKKEAVKVTKDVMMMRAKFEDGDFNDKMLLIMNDFSLDVLERAEEITKALAPFESSIMPPFIKFLAKKQRLSALKPICKEYISSLYFKESIAPVTLKSAMPLTAEQTKAIKEKLKPLTGYNEIKLITLVDDSLIAGFVAEWGYTDPEDLSNPTNGVDYSMKAALENAALNQGVVVEV